MSKLAWIVLLSALSLSAVGQATRDRNLVAMHRHGDQSTLPPSHMNTSQNGQKDNNSQLDKLERQTANTVVQPAAKTRTTPAYKLPPEKQPASSGGFQQTLPVRGGVKNGATNSNANHASRGRVKSYGR